MTPPLPAAPARLRAGARAIRAAALFLLAAAPAASAAGLLGSTGPIDRRTDSIGWCPSANFPPASFDYPSVSFVADGPRATIEFIASNLDSAGTYWTQQTVDNLCVVPRATFDAYWSDSSDCTSCSGSGHFAFDLAPGGQIAYLEQFDSGDGGWETAEGAFHNAATTAPRFPNGVCDNTGGALALGAATGPDTVRTRFTVQGLSAGTEYVFTYWWRSIGDALVTDEELAVEIWGTDPWIDVTPAAIAIPNESHGGAWGDFDGDGDPDLYVTHYNSPPNELFRNDGGFTFSGVTPALLQDADYATGVNWIDPDNDGDLDLFLANQVIGTNRLFENTGNLQFSDATDPLIAGTGTTTQFAWADWDLDGDLDAYDVRFGGGTGNVLLRNDGEAIVDVTPPVLADSGSGSAAGWQDWDLDGDADLYLVNRTGANRLFRNDAGTFVDVTQPPVDDAGPGSAMAWADLDNDLDPDLVLVNTNGLGLVFENLGGGSFSVATGFQDVQFTSVIAGDWDLDGDPDLAMSRQGYANEIWRNDGGFVFTPTVAGPFPLAFAEPTLGISAADGDGDGDLDLFLANGGTAPDRLLENAQDTGHHWIHVDLKGSASNSFGIGARVRVRAAGKDQMQEVTDGGVFVAQNSLTLEFGLGTATTIDEIQVDWPSGAVQYVTPPAVDQRITIEEGSGTGAVAATTATAGFGLQAPVPNPFRGGTLLRFDLPRPGRAELVIYDVRGRRVATLSDGPREAGPHAIRWNGNAASGRPAAPGIYFARLRADGGESVRRIVRLR